MLGIVVVAYKSFDDTVAFVRQELPKITLPCKTVVVDLGSDAAFVVKQAEACQAELVERDGTVSDRDADLFMIHVEENLGFAKGNNLGVQFLMQNFPAVQWLLISNNDIGLREGGAVEELVSQLASHPEAGMAGPRIIDRNGNEQPPFVRPQSFWRLVCYNFLFPVLNRFGDRDHAYLMPAQTNCVTPCYFVCGCFFVMRAAEFQVVGMFDPATFLYCEEQIIAERYATINKHALYCPTVTIDHYSGKTTERHITSTRFVRILQESFRHYFKEYRHAGALSLVIFDLSFRVRLALIRLTDPIQKWRRRWRRK